LVGGDAAQRVGVIYCGGEGGWYEDNGQCGPLVITGLIRCLGGERMLYS
jgi:hypothetical protein